MRPESDLAFHGRIADHNILNESPIRASSIILRGMASVPKKSRRTSNQYRLAQTGIPDYANKSLDEQVALFSKLVMENSKKPIYRVWSKVDSVAQAVIMSELGFFDGEVRAQHYEWARKDSAELNRHTRMLV
jgi:hypothetical protein